MQFKIFDKTYGIANPEQNGITIPANYNAVHYPAPNGTTVINSYTAHKNETCSACSKTIKAGQKTARPNYPATSPYSGPPEQIGNTTVASGVFFCQSCVTGVAPDVRL